MRAFIIRPFGTQHEINFDVVEQQLLSPALEQLGIDGRTTLDILRQGNIRVDMFQRLLTADLIVADLSIHNANVFYELGIRHALRHQHTFLLRANIDKYPFDRQTDRYFTYNKDNPVASLSQLVAALRQTLAADQRDSPVFQLSPDLEEQDRAMFLAVPRDFREDVERAAAMKHRGDLELFAAEVQGLEWESEGLRVIGRAQYALDALCDAGTTWEAVRAFDALDLEANTLLGTIYQRLGDLARSTQALEWVLSVKHATRAQRAEAYTLLGRNAKERWKDDWGNTPVAQQREQALRSAWLEESFEVCARAFNEDLNHFYSGLNALASLTILTELARAFPDVWAERFNSDEEAQRELQRSQERMGKLSAAVALSLQARKTRLEREEKKDIWLDISEADFICLTTQRRPTRVANAYRAALRDAPSFALNAARRQLVLYQQLGILQENVAAALSTISPAPAVGGGTAQSTTKLPQRILLFTGHMIDTPGRVQPRFPAVKEDMARQRIKAAIAAELQLPDGIACGIAGDASGGDILFHEVCAELGIPTHMYLALSKDQFIATSVLPAEGEWVERFNQLLKKLPCRQLAETEELPRWLQDKPHYSIWQRTNLWMLHNALANSDDNVVLLALWDAEAGDGPGGTEDLVKQASARGAKTIMLNTTQIFGL